MADPTIISWQILDDTGRKKAFVEYVNSDATPVSLQAYITAHTPHLDMVVGGQILKVTVTKPYVLPTVKGAPLDDHPISHGGLLKFSATGTAKTFGLWVPSYRLTEIDQGQIANADESEDYIDSFLGGEGSVTPNDADGRALAAFLSGEQRDRK